SWDDTEECPKCGGTGKLPQFAHINDGTCSGCAGVGKVNFNRAADLNNRQAGVDRRAPGRTRPTRETYAWQHQIRTRLGDDMAMVFDRMRRRGDPQTFNQVADHLRAGNFGAVGALLRAWRRGTS